VTIGGSPRRLGQGGWGSLERLGGRFSRNRKGEIQSNMLDGTWEARSRGLRVEALTLSKPALMSRKRVETLSLGLSSVLTS